MGLTIGDFVLKILGPALELPYCMIQLIWDKGNNNEQLQLDFSTLLDNIVEGGSGGSYSTTTTNIYVLLRNQCPGAITIFPRFQCSFGKEDVKIENISPPFSHVTSPVLEEDDTNDCIDFEVEEGLNFYIKSVNSSNGSVILSSFFPECMLAFVASLVGRTDTNTNTNNYTNYDDDDGDDDDDEDNHLNNLVLSFNAEEKVIFDKI